MASSHPQPDWKPLTAEELSSLLPDTYKVLDLLGRGGMGAVYLARQVNLDRLVAIKVLPLQDAAQADDQMNFAERFVQEARTMARISHNGIVAVYDFGRVKVKPANRELLYFVMEYMDGTDVLHLLQEQRTLKPDDALSITAHVCDALAFAHEKGLIHRDIKPANVMINADGFVKVADFGLARPVSMNTSAGLTQSGFAVGTPDFMAPEMLTVGGVTDHRADLYAVGVMLYQMLTGQIPRGSFKPASALCGCDRRFDAIIDKAMQSNPADRYASAEALRADLDRIIATPRAHAGDQTSAALKKSPAAKRKVPAKTPGATPAKAPAPPAPKPPAPPPKAKGRSPALIVSLVLAAGAAFGIWKATRPYAPSTAGIPARPSDPNPARPTTQAQIPAVPVAPSPKVETAPPTKVPPVVSDTSDPSDKPTPHDLLTSSEYEWSQPENLGTKVSSGAHDESPSITGDGLTLWFNSWFGPGKPNNELWFAHRSSLDSPWSSRTKADAPLSHEAIDTCPEISADGLGLVFSSMRNTGFYRLWQTSRASATAAWSEPTPIRSLYANSPGNVSDDHSALAANGLLLVFRSDSRRGGQGKHDLWATGRLSTREEWGPPVNLDGTVNGPESESAPVLSPDGRALLFRRDSGWWVSTRATSGPELNWGAPSAYSLPARLLDGCLSADGSEFIGHAYRGVASGFDDLELVRCRRVRKGSAGVAAVHPADKSDLSDLSDSVKPEPWLAEAKKRGGRLKVFGTDRDGKPMTLGPAEKCDDFVEVHAFHDEYWLARRANGDAVVSRISKTKGERVFEEETGVEQVSRGWKIAYRIRDGRVKQQNAGTLQEWDSLITPNARELLSIHDAIWVLDGGGQILKSYQNPADQVKNRLPPDFFVGNRARTSAELTAVVIGADGRPRGWNARDEPGKVFTSYPDSFKDLVECEGANDSLVVFRDARGRVLATNANGLSTKWAKAAPSDLPPAIRARCGHALQMAQLANGTWRAWGEGEDKGYQLASQINALGPALDLDGSLVQNPDRSKGPDGYVLYIEPAGLAKSGLSDKSDPSDVKTNPTLAPKPAAVPWPVEQPWLKGARQQGGKLKVVGVDLDGQPMDLGPAATLDDFTEVHSYGNAWIARRVNGDAVVAWKPEGRPWQHAKESAVTQVNHGSKPAFRLANGEVKIWQASAEAKFFTRNESNFTADVGGFLVSHFSRLILDRAGLRVAGWQDATAKSPPVDFLAGARAYTASSEHLVSVDARGRPRAWVLVRPDSSTSPLKSYPAAFTDIVECEAASSNFVLHRTRLGRVLASEADGRAKTADSSFYPPASLRPAVRVRAGHNLAAAQTGDGSWQFWGKLEPLARKITAAIDLDASGKSSSDAAKETWGYILYVEPQPGAQGRKPAPKTPPREALSFGRSRFLFVPILGCAPPHWDAARQRAEEMGGRLAQFETPAEQQWVAQNVAANRVKPGQLAWVGGFAESKADGWRWVDGRPMGLVGWRAGQPDAGSTAGAGDFPAFLSLRNVQGGLALHDESDSAEGPHAWPGNVAGFIVEWEP